MRVVDSDEQPGKPKVESIVLRCMEMRNGEMRVRKEVRVR